ncbi:MAG TPA: methyltransferase domain-containing protein [Gaiellaceae bacterium]|nr:methyltransferase domain-containing protein [Gaiellaceae bacterium]
MNPEFLSVLRSPRTGEAFDLDVQAATSNGSVIDGALVTPSGERWPIVAGVPRFAGDQSSSVRSFGHEWHRWARTQFESENVGRPMAGHTKRMWEEICEPRRDLDGALIVDFGCGAGRFIDVLRTRGARAIGLELSSAADVARRNFADDPNVLIVQGDLLNPPFAHRVFDGGFSIGVLHHTPDPATGVVALARVIKEGGWLACCVYPRGEFYDYPSVERVRRLQLRLAPVLGYRFASLYSRFAARALAPVLGRMIAVPVFGSAVAGLQRNWLPFLSLPDPRWAELDIFDAITPEIATTHSPEEVEAWLVDAGCEHIHWTPWCPTSAVATVGGPVLHR